MDVKMYGTNGVYIGKAKVPDDPSRVLIYRDGTVGRIFVRREGHTDLYDEVGKVTQVDVFEPVTVSKCGPGKL